jgi:hypothetical protein
MNTKARLSFLLDSALKDAFHGACRTRGDTPSQVLRQLIDDHMVRPATPVRTRARPVSTPPKR